MRHDDRALSTASDNLEAALEFHQTAGASELALRVDADKFAGADAIRCAAQGIFGAVGSDRNRSEDAQNGPEHRSLKEALVRQEANRTRRCQRKDDGIHVADMVADDKSASGLREVFDSYRADRIAQAREK